MLHLFLPNSNSPLDTRRGNTSESSNISASPAPSASRPSPTWRVTPTVPDRSSGAGGAGSALTVKTSRPISSLAVWSLGQPSLPPPSVPRRSRRGGRSRDGRARWRWATPSSRSVVLRSPQCWSWRVGPPPPRPGRTRKLPELLELRDLETAVVDLERGDQCGWDDLDLVRRCLFTAVRLVRSSSVTAGGSRITPGSTTLSQARPLSTVWSVTGLSVIAKSLTNSPLTSSPANTQPTELGKWLKLILHHQRLLKFIR